MTTPRDRKRSEGRAIFLDAMAPLQVAQQEGRRQGLLEAAEMLERLGMIPAAPRSLALVIREHAAKLPRPPVAE